MAFKFITLLACVSVSFASAQLTGFNNLDFNLNDETTQSTTPVPILRFIDTQNADGSYTYGYENGDGTYKIETRYVTGEVKGKYGYYDDAGVLREVEYGASKMGFEPSGSGLVGPDAALAHVGASAPVAPRPVAPAAPVAPIRATNIRSNGRRVKVVRRRKPQQTQSVSRESQRSAAFETLNERTNDPRTILPQVRRQQFDNFSPIQQQEKPIINRRLPIRPRTTTPRPAQPIQPVQPAQPAQFATFNHKHQDEMRQHQLAVENVLRLQQQQERQTNFQQQQQRQQPNFFAPVSAPVQQAPSNLVQEAGFASNVNLNTGSYTISYGR
jgi:hypothetical protein